MEGDVCAGGSWGWGGSCSGGPGQGSGVRGHTQAVAGRHIHRDAEHYRETDLSHVSMAITDDTKRWMFLPEGQLSSWDGGRGGRGGGYSNKKNWTNLKKMLCYKLDCSDYT